MPFVIRYPKEIKGGQRLDDLILNIDFPALFADYAGIEKPASIQGKSFRENLKGNSPEDWRKSVYYRYWTNDAVRPGHFGIRTDRYKLALFYGHSLDMTGSSKTFSKPAWEFFDLEKDPKEDHNAYADAEYREIIEDMKVELIKLREEVGDTDEKYQIMQDIFKEHWN
jgi:arylsulfatase A-like enzyme